MNNEKLVINLYRSQQKFSDLSPGCGYMEIDGDAPAQIAGPFETLDEGMAALAKLETWVQPVSTSISTVFVVQEYALEEVAYDEIEEEWLSTGEVWAFSRWPDSIHSAGTDYRYDDDLGRLVPAEEGE